MGVGTRMHGRSRINYINMLKPADHCYSDFAGSITTPYRTIYFLNSYYYEVYSILLFPDNLPNSVDESENMRQVLHYRYADLCLASMSRMN